MKPYKSFRFYATTATALSLGWTLGATAEIKPGKPVANGNATAARMVALDLHGKPLPLHEVIPLRCGDTTLELWEWRFKGDSDLLFFAPHDDERVGTEVALERIQKLGGRLLQLKSPEEVGHVDLKNPLGQRCIEFKMGEDICRVDPNRVFSKAGISDSLNEKDYVKNKPMFKKDGSRHKEAVEVVHAFAEALLKELKLEKQTMIVAMHNNREDGDVRLGKYEDRSPFYEAKRSPLLLHKHDFFLVTDAKHYKALGAAQYNVVLENAKPDGRQMGDDGSLSVYCGLRSSAIPYVNIEAIRRHSEQQRRMVEAVIALYLKKTIPPAKPDPK